MGLPADASVVMVFASPSANFLYRENLVPFIGTQSSGKLYRETKLIATYRDYAKTHANPDTDGNKSYHRAVSCKANYTKHRLYHDSRRASKSFAAHPYNLPCAAKHMLFYLPGLRHRDNFIIP
jgi:hypothetical protein